MLKQKSIHLLTILGTITFLCFSFRIIFNKFDENSKSPANEQTSALMPVVAISGGNISLFPYREIEDYIQSNPDHTFLISEVQEENLRQQLQKQSKEKASWTFKVEQRSPGKQLIWVSVHGDRFTEGWYEATDKTISPRYVKRIGAGEALGAALFAFLITGLIGLAFFGSFKLYQRISNKI